MALGKSEPPCPVTGKSPHQVDLRLTSKARRVLHVALCKNEQLGAWPHLSLNPSRRVCRALTFTCFSLHGTERDFVRRRPRRSCLDLRGGWPLVFWFWSFSFYLFTYWFTDYLLLIDFMDSLMYLLFIYYCLLFIYYIIVSYFIII